MLVINSGVYASTKVIIASSYMSYYNFKVSLALTIHIIQDWKVHWNLTNWLYMRFVSVYVPRFWVITRMLIKVGGTSNASLAIIH